MDAARLVGRLMRSADFACRQDDGSIVTAFTSTDLRAAHVVARRLGKCDQAGRCLGRIAVTRPKPM